MEQVHALFIDYFRISLNKKVKEKDRNEILFL